MNTIEYIKETLSLIREPLKGKNTPIDKLTLSQLNESIELMDVFHLPIGGQIHYWRKKQGLTQKELAVKSGIKRAGTIQELESGKYKGNPSVKRIKDVSRALGVGLLVGE